MRFCLIHLDDDGIAPEVLLSVPGMDKTLLEVPFQALPEFLPLLGEAMADAPEARCPACGGDPLGDPAAAGPRR